jgi:hypothetical protein
MPKQVLESRAADHPPLHRDFHAALSTALTYLEQHEGEEAVCDFLRRFVRGYYAPLREALRERGLTALQEFFAAVYAQEEGEAEIIAGPDTLVIRVWSCPAVRHMREHSYPVARLWAETTRSVNEALCEDTPYLAEFLAYDPDTGASLQLFRRRTP